MSTILNLLFVLSTVVGDLASWIGAENTLGDSLAEAAIEHGGVVLLAAAVGAVAFEELAFRLPLARFSLPRACVSASLVAVIFMGGQWRVALFVCGASCGVAFALALWGRSWLTAAAEGWATHFGWIFYALGLTFGLAHLVNYELPWGPRLVLAPLLVLPQLLNGLLFGYVRVRTGSLWTSSLYHLACNASAAVAAAVPFVLHAVSR